MKKFGRFISLIGILALILAATAAWAQPGMGPGSGQGRGGGAGDPYSRMYNPQTVETLTGEVVSVLQGKLEEEVLRFSLAFKEHLKPEQRAAFITFVERRMPNVQGGKGRRSPRWERGKGVGAPQAAEPCGP